MHIGISLSYHSNFNTTSRLCRIMHIPAKPINGILITTSNILQEINYQNSHQLLFHYRQQCSTQPCSNTSIIVSVQIDLLPFLCSYRDCSQSHFQTK